MVGFLAKPLTKERVEDCLRQFMGEQTAQMGSPHVLVVEDDSVNRRVVLSILSRLGITAQSVTDGAQAVIAANDCRFDLILMDCELPELDGPSAAREIIAEHSRFPPVVWASPQPLASTCADLEGLYQLILPDLPDLRDVGAIQRLVEDALGRVSATAQGPRDATAPSRVA